MTTRTHLTLALAAATALSLSACSGSGSPSTSTTVTVAAPTAQASTTSSTPATSASVTTSTTPAATTASVSTTTPTAPTTTVSTGGAATASAPPTTTTAAALTTAATTTAAHGTSQHPPVQGEAGGTVTLAGTAYGRGEGSTQAFLGAMGQPDATGHTSCEVAGAALPLTVYRWGGLSVVVPEKQPGGDYGSSWPKGSIGGWKIVAGTGGAQGVSGPKGTTLGTPLSTLQQRFTTKDWDDASVSTTNGVTRFSIFAGDTTGATFTLDATKHVSEMSAGLGC